MRQIALLILWPVAASAQAVKPEELSSINGRVINAVTGEAIGKVWLQLSRAEPTQPFANWTNSYAASSASDGRFAIRNIDPGKYQLRASRSGFLTVEYGAHGSQRSGTVLDLSTPQQLKDLEIRLRPHGVIAGRVLDVDGEPMEGAQVQILRSQYVNGKKAFATTRTALTNDLGEYRCSGLTPGKYYIYAQNFQNGLPPGSGAPEDYAPVYYPGVTEAAGAVALDVAGGAQVRAADLVLLKSRTTSVKGRVVVELTGATGLPTVSFAPQIGHENSRAGAFRLYRARVNPAGEFEIHTLTAGSYIVSAAIGVGGIWRTSAPVNLEIAGASIDGIVLRIDGGVTIAGRVRVEGEVTRDLQNANLKFRRGGPRADFSSSGSTRIAKDGTFRDENNAPGIYGVLVGGLPEGFYTKSIRVGESEVMYTGIDLTSGASSQVDILVSPNAGLVTGAVNDKSSKPANGATVVMVPREKERLGVSAFYPQAHSDQFGRFTFRNVTPGEYSVYAWEDIESTAWMDTDFMKSFDGKGKSVSVAESAQINVQVDLISSDAEKRDSAER